MTCLIYRGVGWGEVGGVAYHKYPWPIDENLFGVILNQPTILHRLSVYCFCSCPLSCKVRHGSCSLSFFGGGGRLLKNKGQEQK